VSDDKRQPLGRVQALVQLAKAKLGGVDELNSAVQAATVVGAAAAGPLGGTAVGLVGILVSGRLGDYAERKQQQLKDAIKDASERIEKLDEKIDRDFVRTDEFTGLTLRAQIAYLNASREEKLQYIRNFVINSALDGCSSDPDKEMYLHLIDVLTPNQIEYFLAFCRTLVGGDLKRFLKAQEANGMMLTTLAEQLAGRNSPPGTEGRLLEELQIAFRILSSYGLVRAVERNQPRISYHYETTLFTFRFARFVANPEEVII